MIAVECPAYSVQQAKLSGYFEFTVTAFAIIGFKGKTLVSESF